MGLLRSLDIIDQLALIRCPTLVCVGEADPVTPTAAAREIVDGLPPETRRLEVIESAGHFPWLDCPERYGSLVTAFVMTATARHGNTEAPTVAS